MNSKSEKFRKYVILFTIIFCMLTSVLSFSAFAQNDSEDDELFTYDLIVPSSLDYCNCDSDCQEDIEDIDGCLTDDSSQFLRDLNSNWPIYVEDAHSNGYNGVCARLLFANSQTPYKMTESCEMQIEIVEEPEEDPEPEASLEDELEDAAKSLLGTISGSITEESENTNSGSTNKESRGGDTMDISSAQLIAMTVIVIGFFGLMGWITYLLQK